MAEGMECFIQLGGVKVTGHHTPAQGALEQNQAQLAGLDLHSRIAAEVMVSDACSGARP
jgi:hypothetical protein